MLHSILDGESTETRGSWLVFVTCLALALPCLAFRYLPMTDLPQHVAVVSIMRHLHDPAYGFSEFYVWALNRTLYGFPYFLALAFAYLIPVKLAVQLTVFLALLAFPAGVIMFLRATRRPAWLGFLAIPLMYHRGFFWGFMHFCWAIGLAFIAIALLVGPWSRRRAWAFMGLSLLIAVTHIYGLLMLFGYSAAWLVAGRRRELAGRLVWAIPSLLALGAWGVLAAHAPGYGRTEWLAPFQRVMELGHSILGGYADRSEAILLGLWFAAALLLAAPSAPISWRRIRELTVPTRAAYLFAAANLVAYFVLPVATPTAKFIHFRHAVLAAMMVPLLIDRVPEKGPAKRACWLVVIAAMFAVPNTWWHLARFAREAGGFDTILESVPARSHIAQLTYDSNGSVMRTHPYLHFGAYAQARNGGMFAVSFPMLFWPIPIKGRDDSGVPSTPKNMEWEPLLFNERHLGRFYELVLIRSKPGAPAALSHLVDRSLQISVDGWQLYRRSPGSAPRP